MLLVLYYLLFQNIQIVVLYCLLYVNVMKKRKALGEYIIYNCYCYYDNNEINKNKVKNQW